MTLTESYKTNYQIWQTAGGTLGKMPNGAPVDTNVAQDLSLWQTTESDIFPGQNV